MDPAVTHQVPCSFYYPSGPVNLSDLAALHRLGKPPQTEGGNVFSEADWKAAFPVPAKQHISKYKVAKCVSEC